MINKYLCLVNNTWQYTDIIKKKAEEFGFLHCGIAKADFLKQEAPRVEKWLKNNMHGEMHYMNNHFDKRLDPRKLVEGTKSIISLSYNYFPAKVQNKNAPQISKYAYGEDYHKVIKKKIKTMLNELKNSIGDFSCRYFVDSAPVMEKAWAEKAGIGWRGKNTNLINPREGSFFFLAEILIDIELAYDNPIKDYCGTCTKCIDACPTDAIVEPYVVDGSKCISYFTIELKDEILPNEMKGKFENWAFGCDICQDVCPWNRFSKPHQETAFEPHFNLLNFTKREWEELNEEMFQEIFKKSAVKRTKFEGLKRNIEFLKMR